ncbi:hypothetical protein [Croceibacterium atlanticum]|uniref:hypothetical protein n=1 Tax=Croceibacterium atlanticum TaxID=1267766 RepID=UPI0006B35372|nr:hypothetical protein [Croceibacterium atlanticum]
MAARAGAGRKRVQTWLEPRDLFVRAVNLQHQRRNHDNRLRPGADPGRIGLLHAPCRGKYDSMALHRAIAILLLGQPHIFHIDDARLSRFRERGKAGKHGKDGEQLT